MLPRANDTSRYFYAMRAGFESTLSVAYTHDKSGPILCGALYSYERDVAGWACPQVRGGSAQLIRVGVPGTGVGYGFLEPCSLGSRNPCVLNSMVRFQEITRNSWGSRNLVVRFQQPFCSNGSRNPPSDLPGSLLWRGKGEACECDFRSGYRSDRK